MNVALLFHHQINDMFKEIIFISMHIRYKPTIGQAQTKPMSDYLSSLDSSFQTAKTHNNSVIKAQSKKPGEMAKACKLNIHPGSILGNCYKVEAILGEGGFGFVTKCLNTETNEKVAIKVNKNCPYTLQQAREEIAILKRLQCLDPDACNIVRWNGFFLNKESICLNFELLDQSLYDYLKSRKFQGLSMEKVRPIVHQVATTLYHLSSLELVHADIKMENIMIVDCRKKKLKVKLIDFGLAVPRSAIYPGLSTGTLWYRAPEVILELPFDEAIDMWALGLVVVELVTGQPLYNGLTDSEMLKFIIETQGQPPDHVLDRGLQTEYYFDRQGNDQQSWTFKSSEQVMNQTGKIRGKFHKLRCLDDLEHLIVNDKENQSDRRLLVDLIKKMLHLDPDQRIKPLEVLHHPFVSQILSKSSKPDTTKQKIDNKGTPEVNQHDQTARPDTNHFRLKKTAVNIDDRDVENMGYLRRFMRWITDTFYSYYNYYFPQNG